MPFLTVLIHAVQILSALGVIGLVLLQHGKGADMGAAFGSGASGSLFGASGSANFLSRATAILATLFFAATLALTYLGSYRPAASLGVLGAAPAAASAASAAVPASAAPAAAASTASAVLPASGPGQDVPK